MEVDIPDTAVDDSRKMPLYKLIDELLDEEKNTDETLISHDNLTSILKTDFNIYLDNMSAAEIESYIFVLKWSLKGWPGWDQMTDEEKGPRRDVMKEYQSIKRYISLRMRITRRCIEAIEKKNSDSEKRGKLQLRKNERLVLKVSCSNRQLKSLINSRISHTHRLINFRVPLTVEPISANEGQRYQWMSFMDVFSWPHLEVTVDLPTFSFVHRNVSSSEYKVFNSKGPHPFVSREKLDRNVRVKNVSGRKQGLRMEFIMEYLDQAIKYISDARRMNTSKKNDITGLFQEIARDMSAIKDYCIIGADYKYNLSDYTYQQLLSNPIDITNLANDDLFKKYSHIEPQLHHLITPCVRFTLNRFQCPYSLDANGKRVFDLGLDSMERVNNTWLRIYCILCDVTISGFLSFQELNAHLTEKHGSGHDWRCVKCDKGFNVLELAYRRWSHPCC